jgi:hypothetical protein
VYIIYKKYLRQGEDVVCVNTERCKVVRPDVVYIKYLTVASSGGTKQARVSHSIRTPGRQEMRQKP